MESRNGVEAWNRAEAMVRRRDSARIGSTARGLRFAAAHQSRHGVAAQRCTGTGRRGARAAVGAEEPGRAGSAEGAWCRDDAARSPARLRRGDHGQPAHHRQQGDAAGRRAEDLRVDVRGHRIGARPHQHGDLHPRRRRGRQALRRCLACQAGGRGAGQRDVRQRGRARHAQGLLPATDRRRHQGAAIQPGQPARGQGRLGRERARPSQAARRRRPDRDPRRHQHQQRLFGRLAPIGARAW